MPLCDIKRVIVNSSMMELDNNDKFFKSDYNACLRIAYGAAVSMKKNIFINLFRFWFFLSFGISVTNSRQRERMTSSKVAKLDSNPGCCVKDSAWG